MESSKESVIFLYEENSSANNVISSQKKCMNAPSKINKK